MSEKLLDFVGKRKENIEKKRRSFERIMFRNLLGVYTVIDQEGSLHPVDLVDISRDGCLLRAPTIPNKSNELPKDTEIVVKLYFTENSFLPAVVNIKYSNIVLDEDGNHYIEYGCEFDKSVSSFESWRYNRWEK